MDLILYPRKLRGDLTVIPSKSQAHRALICAAFADADTELICPEVNRDMEATARCLQSLGAVIKRTETGYLITPAREIPQEADLPCGESGSTLRFLLPVVGALGIRGRFYLEGRLPKRPLSPLWEEMERMGCSLSRPEGNTILVTGKLQPGEYRLRGDVSSQFITGLLLAGALIPGTTRITLLSKLQSRPYVDMTLDTMKQFGKTAENLALSGGSPFRSPGTLTIEGDWSSAAFFLAANALGSEITLKNLNPDSCQGDRAAAVLLPALKEFKTISAEDIPDLVPILAVTAACHQGAEFTEVSRLRLKESDRVESTVSLIRSLGGSAEAQGDRLLISGTGLRGGTVNTAGDHRIAMAAAIAATAAKNPVIIPGAECVAKSYPRFFQEYSRLGGYYEQYIR